MRVYFFCRKIVIAILKSLNRHPSFPSLNIPIYTFNVWTRYASSLDSSFRITVVFAEHWTRIVFQTLSDLKHLQRLHIWFSVSTEKIYTFSNKCENILIVSECAHTLIYTVQLKYSIGGRRKKTTLPGCSLKPTAMDWFWAALNIDCDWMLAVSVECMVKGYK